ncbi:MAG: pyridoxal-phosphate dependent enzyme [Gemmatimonadaceae bacterium]|nr:pyridoxal-phosphate dependent enzyme [Gemmatimonadaceae bacterium]
MPSAVLPAPDAIRAAATRLDGVTVRTPLRRSAALAARLGGEVWLKLETEQTTGSFKLRGAYNALAQLDDAKRAAGVVASSAGNHGLGVAEAAQRLGIRATIFVPHDAPQVKKSGIASRGATVNDEEPDYDAAMARARREADRTGATFIHPCLGAALLAGQGTVALEVLEELPTLATFCVCVGGAGLLGGVGGWLRGTAPLVRIVGAQSERTNAMHVALSAGRLIDIPSLPTLADGLAGQIDEFAFQVGREALDALAVVTEAEIAFAIDWLWSEEGVRAEGAGAVTVAALLAGKVSLIAFPLAATVSGGNIDDARFAAARRGEVPALR